MQIIAASDLPRKLKKESLLKKKKVKNLDLEVSLL